MERIFGLVGGYILIDDTIFPVILNDISHHEKSIFEFLQRPKLEVVLSVVVDLDNDLVAELSLLTVIGGGLSHLEGDISL